GPPIGDLHLPIGDLHIYPPYIYRCAWRKWRELYQTTYSNRVMPDRDVPRVLVVDDDARVRRFLTSALGAAGFAVTATGIGAEGLRLADSRPDLIVLDVELPDLSGREVCRRLKAAEETAAIPVLMLSGVFTDVADRSQ